MLNLNLKKLKVYSNSILLVKQIYELTSMFPNDEKFGIISQLRRAAVSIPSNLAEGASRKTVKERIRIDKYSFRNANQYDESVTVSPFTFAV